MKALEAVLFSDWNIKPTQTIGFIFDLDELLFDNRQEIFLAYQSLLSSRNISMRRNETFPGKNLFDIISIIKKQYNISGSVDSLIKERRSKYIELLNGSSPKVKKGVREVFHFFEKNKDKVNFRLAYASSSEKTFTDIILKKIFEHCQLTHYVDNPDSFFYKNSDNVCASTCWEKGLEKKPSPMLYIETLKKLGLSPNQCLAFEDSKSGVEAALSAGVGVIFIPSVSHEKEFLNFNRDLSCNNKFYRINSLLDFLPTLLSLSNAKNKELYEQ